MYIPDTAIFSTQLSEKQGVTNVGPGTGDDAGLGQ